jgi:hypothetical protein
MQAREPQMGPYQYGQRMRSSNVSGTWNNDSSTTSMAPIGR